MKFLKMLSLAAVAAAAVLALVGATGASADRGCKVEVADSGECAAANLYALPLAISAKTPVGTKAELVASGLGTKCDSSVTGEATASDGPHTQLLGLLKTLTFTNCEGSCKNATAENLPYNVEALALALLWHINNNLSHGIPAALLECSLFGIPVNCLYEATGQTALLNFTPGNPAKLVANKVPLSRGTKDSQACPATGVWNATYEITTPKPLWLTALP